MQKTIQIISLIGYRGTGKTSVGKLLAKKIGFSHYDSDHEIERDSKQTIANLFEDKGEHAFREKEQHMVQLLLQKTNAVISTGGGAILNENTRTELRKAGPVIWLTAETETIMKRLANDADTTNQRPALTNLPPREEIKKTLNHRTPLYQECASLTVATDTLSTSEIAEQILNELNFDAEEIQ